MQRKLTPYLLVAPLMVFIVAFTYVPIVTSLDLSFRDWDFLSDERPWVGLNNYGQLFASHDFWNALRVAHDRTQITRALDLGVTVFTTDRPILAIVRRDGHGRATEEVRRPADGPGARRSTRLPRSAAGCDSTLGSGLSCQFNTDWSRLAIGAFFHAAASCRHSARSQRDC